MTANYHSKIRLLVAAAVVCGGVAYYACLAGGGGPPSPHDLSAFFDAIRKGNVSEVQRFLNNGVGADVTDEAGRPPLVVLYQQIRYPGTPQQRVAIAKLLIDRGADVNGIIPLHLNPEHVPVFAWVVISGNVDEVQLFLKSGADPNGFGRSPLFNAVWRGSVPIVRLLLEHGADVNARDQFGQTPLFLVEDPAVAKFLLDSGADVNVLNNRGQSALKVLSDPNRGSKITWEEGYPVNAAIREPEFHRGTVVPVRFQRTFRNDIPAVHVVGATQPPGLANQGKQPSLGYNTHVRF